MISDQNCRTGSSTTILLQPVSNRRIQTVPKFILSILLKNGKENAFTSHFVHEMETTPYRAKTVRFKTGMTRFRAEVI